MLKVARIGPLAILFFVIFAFAVWLLLAVELPGDSRVIYELQNAGHTLVFCALTAALIKVLHHYAFSTALPSIGVAVLLAIFFAGFSEFIQPWFGRDSSWSDLYKNFLGILAGVVFSFTWLALAWKRKLAWIATALLILFGLCEPIYWYLAKIKRDSLFPVLGDFESALASKYFNSSYRGKFQRVPTPEEWANNRGTVAQVEFRSGKFPGFKAFDLRGNWSNYETLKFEIFNPHAEELELVIRIHDNQHNNEHNDRFNHTFKVPVGENHFSFNISDIEKTRSGRKLKLGSIRVMMLYMSRPKQAYTLYFDNFRLE